MNPIRRQPIPPFQRRIPSRLEAIDALCVDLREHLVRHRLQRRLFGVELLARECLNNGIRHGNRFDTCKTAEIRVLVGPRWIRLQVIDQGPGFPWRRRSRRSLPDENLPGGRGLALCATYAARVQLNRPGNRITLWIPR